MSKKLLVIGGSALLGIVFLGAVGATFFLLWGKLSSLEAFLAPQIQAATAEAAADNAEGTGSVHAELGELIALEPFIINLAGSEGKRYLKVTMELELSPDEEKAPVMKRIPQFRDGILMILPSKTYADISNVEGKNTLRSTIRDTLNTLSAGNVIANVYFTEFVVQ